MRILLTEDREDYLKASQEYFNGKCLSVDYALDYDKSMELLGKNDYNGVITDIFIPKNTGSGDKSLGLEVYDRILQVLGRMPDGSRELREAITNGSEDQQPLGVAIAEAAEKKGIPFILCSSLYHHATIANPICAYQRKKGWMDIVDGNEGLPESLFSSSSLKELKSEKDLSKSQPEFWERAHRILSIVIDEMKKIAL